MKMVISLEDTRSTNTHLHQEHGRGLSWACKVYGGDQATTRNQCNRPRARHPAQDHTTGRRNTPMSSKTEQKLEDTIANILQENHTQPISEESADEEETEVEKKRRLQALGYLPSSRRDREDEEE